MRVSRLLVFTAVVPAVLALFVSYAELSEAIESRIAGSVDLQGMALPSFFHIKSSDAKLVSLARIAIAALPAAYYFAKSRGKRKLVFLYALAGLAAALLIFFLVEFFASRTFASAVS